MTAKAAHRTETELPLADADVEALVDWLARACERRSATEQRAASRDNGGETKGVAS